MNKTNQRILNKQISYMIKTIGLDETYRKNVDELIEEQGIEEAFELIYHFFVLHENTLQKNIKL